MCVVDKLGYGLVSRSQLREHFRQSVRKFTRRTLQTVMAGTALSVGIYAFKHIHPAVSFWDHHTVTFQPHIYTYPPNTPPDLVAAISRVQKSCSGVDFLVAKISQATSSVHLQEILPFVKNVQPPQELSDFKVWAIQKISDHAKAIHSRTIPRPPRSESGHLIYGCDANVECPEFLDKAAIGPAQISQAADAFSRDGVVVVKAAPLDVQRLRHLLNIKPDYLTKRSENGGNFRTRSIDFPGIVQGEEDALLDVSIHARPHVTLRLTKFQEEIVNQISCVMPLVWELLHRQRPTRDEGCLFDVFISDIQLVASEPTAARTQWTAMNGGGAGLTLTIPLTLHIPHEHGAKLLIPGSQDFRSLGGFFKALRSVLSYGGVVAYRPEIADVAITDGRLVMREQANRSFSATDAALVIRFDWRDKKPVGIENPAVAAFYNFFALCLEAISWIHNKV